MIEKLYRLRCDNCNIPCDETAEWIVEGKTPLEARRAGRLYYKWYRGRKPDGVMKDLCEACSVELKVY